MMSSTNEMQQFEMENVLEERLKEIEDSLKEHKCINIAHKLETGGYTITALCPKREELD